MTSIVLPWMLKAFLFGSTDIYLQNCTIFLVSNNFLCLHGGNSSSLGEISLYFPSFAIIRSFGKLIVKRKTSRAEIIPEQYGGAS